METTCPADFRQCDKVPCPHRERCKVGASARQCRTAFEQQQASAGEVGEKVTVPLADWLLLFERLGMAEGLLAGWLYADRDNARAKAATEAFLADRGVTVAKGGE